MPIQSDRTIERKISKVVEDFLEQNKQTKSKKVYDFSQLLNVTDENGQWLCQEDKQFYELQVSSKGAAGYCTGKSGDNDLHPRTLSKLKRLQVRIVYFI